MGVRDRRYRIEAARCEFPNLVKEKAFWLLALFALLAIVAAFQTSDGHQSVLDQQGIKQSPVNAKASSDKANANFNGTASDSFQCANSTENQPIVSFDGGNSWWKDDGRCTARLQRKRDDDAQVFSYWSTTIRVNTDMDSFWLPDEERTCQTLPDEKGRVATVTCDATAHANHNIPVKFWGGVDRDTVSNWKCRREGNTFVCRAID